MSFQMEEEEIVEEDEEEEEAEKDEVTEYDGEDEREDDPVTLTRPVRSGRGNPEDLVRLYLHFDKGFL